MTNIVALRPPKPRAASFTALRTCYAARLTRVGISRLAGTQRRFLPADIVRMAIASRLWRYGFHAQTEVWDILSGTVDPAVTGLSVEAAVARLDGLKLVVGRAGMRDVAFARLTAEARSDADNCLTLDVGAIARDAANRLEEGIKILPAGPRRTYP